MARDWALQTVDVSCNSNDGSTINIIAGEAYRPFVDNFQGDINLVMPGREQGATLKLAHSSRGQSIIIQDSRFENIRVGMMDEEGSPAVAEAVLRLWARNYTIVDTAFVQIVGSWYGAVVVELDAFLTLSHSRCSLCSATRAPCIAMEGPMSGLDIVSSAFTHNHGTDMPDGSEWSSSGAVRVLGSVLLWPTVIIRNSLFDQNRSDREAGALSTVDTRVYGDTVMFSNNTAAAGAGGAVLVRGGSLQLDGSTLEANTAQADGGAVEVSDAPFASSDTSYNNNSAGGRGGAVHTAYITCATCWLSMSGGSLASNTARGAGGALAADLQQRLTLAGVRYEGNSAAGEGGAVALQTCVAPRGSSCPKVKPSSTQVSVRSCTFVANSAALLGGALNVRQAAAGGTLNIKGTLFYGNSAASAGASGGALYAIGLESVILEQCRMERNIAAAAGAAVLDSIQSSIVIMGSFFLHNHCQPANTTDASARISTVNDAAMSAAGALQLLRGTPRTQPLAVGAARPYSALLDGSTFDGNTCGEAGALLLQDAAATAIRGCSFTSNSATQGTGGAVVVRGAAAAGARPTFSRLPQVVQPPYEPPPPVYGPVVPAYGASSHAGSIADGMPPWPSAVISLPSADTSTQFWECTFTGNMAAAGGGALAVQATVAHITGGVFEGNAVHGGAYSDSFESGMGESAGTAGAAGGAILAVGCPAGRVLELERTTLQHNHASAGGALAARACGVALQAVIATNNTASGSGGALQVMGTAAGVEAFWLQLTGCTLEANAAQVAGGAVQVLQAGLHAVNCSFLANTAGSSGGAVDAVDAAQPPSTAADNSSSSSRTMPLGKQLTLQACVFRGNAAAGSGGAIAHKRSVLDVQAGCTFDRNQAGYASISTTSNTWDSAGGAGGAIFGQTCAGTTTLNASLLAGNAAGIAGGAVALFVCEALMLGCTFTGNAAGRFGGAMAAADAPSTAVSSSSSSLMQPTVRLVSSVFRDNTARMDAGGALHTTAVGLRVGPGCTFARNKAATMGGAVFFSGASTGAEFLDSSFSSNRALGLLAGGSAAMAAGGGAVAGELSSWASIESCSFQSNQAGHGSGGGVRLVRLACVYVHNTSFAANLAADGGGALSVALPGEAAAVDMSEDDAADGMLRSTEQAVTQQQGTGQDTPAAEGPSSCTSPDAVVRHAAWLGNLQLLWQQQANESHPATNSSDGDVAPPTASVLLASVMAVNNTATGRGGGALHLEGLASTTVLSLALDISSNTAMGTGGAGGAVLVERPTGHSTVLIWQAKMANNRALQGDGGAVALAVDRMGYRDAASGSSGPTMDFRMYNATLEHNTAGRGGGVALGTGCSLVLGQGCTLSANEASGDGGGVFGAACRHVHIEGAAVQRCTAKAGSGGAVALDGCAAFSAMGAGFALNSAALGGGAVMLLGLQPQAAPTSTAPTSPVAPTNMSESNPYRRLLPGSTSGTSGAGNTNSAAQAFSLVALSGCSFEGNSAGILGSIRALPAAATQRGSMAAGALAGAGGALLLQGRALLLAAQCGFSHNAATGLGGAVALATSCSPLPAGAPEINAIVQARSGTPASSPALALADVLPQTLQALQSYTASGTCPRSVLAMAVFDGNSAGSGGAAVYAPAASALAATCGAPAQPGTLPLSDDALARTLAPVLEGRLDSNNSCVPPYNSSAPAVHVAGSAVSPALLFAFNPIKLHLASASLAGRAGASAAQYPSAGTQAPSRAEGVAGSGAGGWHLPQPAAPFALVLPQGPTASSSGSAPLLVVPSLVGLSLRLQLVDEWGQQAPAGTLLPSGLVLRAGIQAQGQPPQRAAALRPNHRHRTLLQQPPAPSLLGNTEAVLYSGDGSARFAEFKLLALTGAYTLRFDVVEMGEQQQQGLTASSISSLEIAVQVPACRQGYYTEAGSCQRCIPGTYSLGPDAGTGAGQCSPCPEAGVCPGGPLLLPQPGYWHSSSSSPQMHRCLAALACRGASPHQPPTGAASSSSIGLLQACQDAWYSATPLLPSLNPAWQAAAAVNASCVPSHLLPDSAPNSYTALQCTPGYSGRLCATCGHSNTWQAGTSEAAYGRSEGYECAECPSPTAAWLASVGAFLLSTLLLWGAVALTFTSSFGHSYSCNWDMSAASGDWLVRGLHARPPAHDVIRVLAVHMQLFVTVTRVRLPWPAPVRGLQTALLIMVGTVSRWHTCLAGASSSSSTQATALIAAAFFLPLASVLLVMLLWALRWLVRRRHARQATTAAWGHAASKTVSNDAVFPMTCINEPASGRMSAADRSQQQPLGSQSGQGSLPHLLQVHGAHRGASGSTAQAMRSSAGPVAEATEDRMRSLGRTDTAGVAADAGRRCRPNSIRAAASQLPGAGRPPAIDVQGSSDSDRSVDFVLAAPPSPEIVAAALARAAQQKSPAAAASPAARSRLPRSPAAALAPAAALRPGAASCAVASPAGASLYSVTGRPRARHLSLVPRQAGLDLGLPPARQQTTCGAAGRPARATSLPSTGLRTASGTSSGPEQKHPTGVAFARPRFQAPGGATPQPAQLQTSRSMPSKAHPGSGAPPVVVHALSARLRPGTTASVSSQGLVQGETAAMSTAVRLDRPAAPGVLLVPPPTHGSSHIQDNSGAANYHTNPVQDAALPQTAASPAGRQGDLYSPEHESRVASPVCTASAATVLVQAEANAHACEDGPPSSVAFAAHSTSWSMQRPLPLVSADRSHPQQPPNPYGHEDLGSGHMDTLPPLMALDKGATLPLQLLLSWLTCSFFLLANWVHTALSILACHQLDSGAGLYAEHQRATWHAGYWLQDMNQECFTGDHVSVWLPIGICAVVLCAAVMPLTSTAMLLVTSWRCRMRQPGRQQLYAALQARFRPHWRLFGDSAGQLEVVGLVSLEVFGFTMGGNRQAVLMGVLIAVLVMGRLLLAPLRQCRLQRLEVSSLAVLLATLLLGLLYSSGCSGNEAAEAPQVWESLLSAVIIGVNSAFLLCLLWLIASLSWPDIKQHLCVHGLCVTGRCHAAGRAQCHAREVGPQAMPGHAVGAVSILLDPEPLTQPGSDAACGRVTLVLDPAA